MATSKSINPLAVEQAAVSFGTIASLANSVRELCVEAVMNMGDHDNAANMATAASDLASQIGLLADIGACSLGGMVMKGTNPSRWLQPPIYPHGDESEGAHHE